MLRPKQHLLHLRPRALLTLPKFKKAKTPCQKPKNAPREGTKSTAMPLAVTKTLPTPPHSTTTCLKKSTMPQEAEMLHPNQRSLGVLGAPKTAAPTIIQLPTAPC